MKMVLMAALADLTVIVERGNEFLASPEKAEELVSLGLAEVKEDEKPKTKKTLPENGEA